MFSVHDKSQNPTNNVNRRELLRIGGLGFAGLSLADLLQSKAQADSTETRDRTFGQARNVIVLWMQGGPPQHETWDPKPNAPVDIRGEFRPICTNVPGIQICELLPRTAARADLLAVVRSMVTNNHVHSASGYHVLTGYSYRGSNARQITPNDWPYWGSVVKALKPSESLPAFSTVWLPDVMRLNENVQPAGQTAGILGPRFNPERIRWDPANPESQIAQFSLPPEISPVRLSNRQRLLTQLDQRFREVERSGAVQTYNNYVQEAFSVLGSGRARQAFDINRESVTVRDRYGRTKWGQCVLLARRLVEAGVRLVHVNWPREPGDSAVDNPMWDTHALNADRLQDVLCPTFDISFSALLDDLEQRGLLDETLVLAIAEFGRTPRINNKAGRDHWGSVFSFVMAGAGIRTAQVYGASDRIGAYAQENPVTPDDLTATLFHLLGIEPNSYFRDPTGRPHLLTRGRPISALLGNEPATQDRRTPEGDVLLVQLPTDEKLFNINFADGTALIQAGTSSRIRGWQADPIYNQSGFGARLTQRRHTNHEGWQVELGFRSTPSVALSINRGQRIMLAQEIRNARAGQYCVNIRFCGLGSSRQDYENFFRRHFTCRLILFRYNDPSKDPRRGQQLATRTITPTFQEVNSVEFTTVRWDRSLDSPAPGQNFAIGLGLGVAVVVEKTSAGRLAVEARDHSACLAIDSLEVIFGGRDINEDVQV